MLCLRKQWLLFLNQRLEHIMKDAEKSKYETPILSLPLTQRRKQALGKININESLGISRNRINKRQVKEYLYNLNIYKSQSWMRFI